MLPLFSVNKRKKDRLVVLLGPTAVGKTSLAVDLAAKIKGEIISADSRQVYKRMDLGTGKDLMEYQKEGQKIPYHLIDILEPGEMYDIFQFQRDLYLSYHDTLKREAVPILCGGSGLYIEAALRKEKYIEVPEDPAWRSSIKESSFLDLKEELVGIKQELHNTTDLIDRERLVRALEIARYEMDHKAEKSPIKDHVIFGIRMEREALRDRIKERLDQRLEAGMIKEVEDLLQEGVEASTLNYYGLEYRYLSKFLMGEIEYEEMYSKLLQEIRRFAKKQMTWFRRMEKQGYEINWIDAEMKQEEKLNSILDRL